jgi:hypothetical protein
MNKYELKYLLETLISSNDRLTDVAGKQTTHIAELWTEIGLKNENLGCNKISKNKRHPRIL